MFRLHFNSGNGIFTVRRVDRSIVAASERRGKLPLIGDIVSVAPRVHILVSAKDFSRAMNKERPVLSVAVTRFPKVRLFFKWLKEVF